MEGSREVTIMFHKFAEIASKAKVALCFLEVLERGFPVSDGFELGFVNSDVTVGNDVAKIFNASCSEIAFLEFAKPFGVGQALKDLGDMFFVLIE